MANEQAVDVNVVPQGTVVLFELLTESARQWVEEHVQLEGWQWMGNASFAVEHRYAGDLVEGMVGDGLSVSGR